MGESPDTTGEQQLTTPKRFRVLVDDNFHYQKEDERYQAGEFDEYANALEKCKKIVEECLQEQLQPG
jgi:hypothetical protein